MPVTDMAIFVSHSHEDADFCQALVAALRRAGADVWYDEHNLGAGPLTQTIEIELRRRAVFIVVLSSAALASRWVRLETERACKLFERNPTRIILPVVVAPIDDLNIWLVIEGFKRIEAPGALPFPRDEAICRTLRTLDLALPGESPIPVDPQVSADIQEMLARVRALLAQHRYYDALPLVERIVVLAPHSFEAWACKARVHDELNQGAPALEAAEQALHLNPQSAMAWSSRAGGLAWLFRFDEALVAAEVAVVLDPNDVVAWHNRGAVLYLLERFEDALVAFERALSLDPFYVYALVFKSLTLSDLGRHEEEMAIYQRFPEFTSFFVFLWHYKGVVLNTRSRNEEALAAFDQALRFDPEYKPALVDKEQVLRALNRVREADEIANQVKQLPNHTG